MGTQGHSSPAEGEGGRGSKAAKRRTSDSFLSIEESQANLLTERRVDAKRRTFEMFPSDGTFFFVRERECGIVKAGGEETRASQGDSRS